MVVYVVVTSFLQNVAFLIYALFGEILILEIPVGGKFSLSAGLAKSALSVVGCTGAGPTRLTQHSACKKQSTLVLLLKELF